MVSSHPARLLKLQAKVNSVEEAHYLASLYSWLLEDSASLNDVSVETVNKNHPGQMAGSFDIVIAVAGQVTSLGSLVLAYLSWRKSMQQEANSERLVKVQMEVNGKQIAIEGMDDAQIQKVVTSLARESD
ncbi:hypothetical protein OG890_20510 [Streptomyces anulatus]|uniref:effector-associated constant component EACC1 n=1 Tax=Streptomyces anulatus TaxID=1892 RepID=UPI0022502A4A|nr:hypothetical protein [Streptomyces anulatus]MCX4486311.1 hypothetical protein [Streptomyces anulatus]